MYGNKNKKELREFITSRLYYKILVKSFSGRKKMIPNERLNMPGKRKRNFKKK